MSVIDPKDKVRIIIRQVFDDRNIVIRTRSGRGWYLYQSAIVNFVSTVTKNLLSSEGVVFLDSGFNFEGQIRSTLATRYFTSEQICAQAIIKAINIKSEDEIVKILMDAMSVLQSHFFVNKWARDDKQKEEYISKVIDNLFKTNGYVIVDTVDAILKTVVPILLRYRRILSAQDCAILVVGELKRAYAKKP